MEQSEFETMLALDERHWWYRGRRRVLRAVLDRLELPSGASVLDAGCGSGRTLDELRRYGETHGMELNPLGVAAARSRGHHDVREGPLEAIPFEDSSFDLVTCLDVIEHTDDDVASLRELRRVARPDATLVVTVPAHPSLWSRHDDVNGHRRRYTRRTLGAAARAAGWEVERQTGFNVVYLAPAALVR
ncbi:MAG TPA: class I SAM-dependent methyltransferase, partial [Candidatus Dormibacteraeota bacterium]